MIWKKRSALVGIPHGSKSHTVTYEDESRILEAQLQVERSAACREVKTGGDLYYGDEGHLFRGHAHDGGRLGGVRRGAEYRHCEGHAVMASEVVEERRRSRFAEKKRTPSTAGGRKLRGGRARARKSAGEMVCVMDVETGMAIVVVRPPDVARAGGRRSPDWGSR